MREIVNSERTGAYIKIALPGFDGAGETCRVHYLIEGEGEDLLFIHSPGQSLYTFREMVGPLSGSFRCILPDLPGSGFSGRPQSLNYSVEEMADCILAVMDALEIKKTHAVGASVGALYLIEAVKKAPERFGKLTLFCPGGIKKEAPPLLRSLTVPVLGSLTRELYSFRTYGKMLETAFYDATLCTEKVRKQYYRSADDYASRQAFMYALRNADEDAAFSGAERLRNETFLLWGGFDKWSDKKNMSRARDALPLAWHYVIENAGHLFWEEKGAVTADAVERFIRYEGEEDAE